ncbi:MAG TPA: hypothetical protein DCS07_03945 [Bdellovibrionales bacterium]|nr:MAG: hypothetical protein A2X97_15270 [Bdellovibrionales bacterium GWA1_52_35]OFZ33289.1 MAG: hypothetical protein A2070_14660 [Bdellovibrionales bacterium GWC1_52_8]HAR41770.1 hypothetical protein [Bdellovibrionales bacterium]HCM40498.1 hypothetical protein [Bdellovibrionales bacterium]
MERLKIDYRYRAAFAVMLLVAVCGLAFAAGLVWSRTAYAAPVADKPAREPRVVYPKKTDLDFEGAQIEGEVRNPGEFYFQHRPEEKFDSLVKRRKNFHKEMLRDVVLSK